MVKHMDYFQKVINFLRLDVGLVHENVYPYKTSLPPIKSRLPISILTM